MNAGRLQDILEPTVNALRVGQTFRIGGTQIRRLSKHVLHIERWQSVSVTVLTAKPVWEVIGVQMVIGGEYTQRDHGLYNVPTFQAQTMKQRFADEKLAQTIMDELIGHDCFNCDGSGVVGITRYDDGAPSAVPCHACGGQGVAGQVVTSGLLELIPY